MKKKMMSLILVMAAVLMITACGKSAPTFVKDGNASEKFTFTMSAKDANGKAVFDTKVEVQGSNANLMEIMDWYLGQESINFVHLPSGLVSAIGDLESSNDEGWLMYVNGEMAEVGAADYIPAKGDKIEWSYVKYSEIFNY